MSAYLNRIAAEQEQCLRVAVLARPRHLGDDAVVAGVDLARADQA